MKDKSSSLSATYDDAHKRLFSKKKRPCPLTGEDAPKIDYKDVKLLKRFVSERGRMLPGRITAVSSGKQRKLSLAIKRARMLALLPFVEL